MTSKGAGMDVFPKSGEEFDRLQNRLKGWMESFPKWHDHFVWMPNEKPAWTVPQKPLSQSRVSLVTSTGVHLRSQDPFDVKSDYGDWSFRVIPSDADTNDFLISDAHYDHSEADQDINCVFPITHLWSLKSEGVIGDISKSFYSFMGFIPDPTRLKNETAPQVARLLKKEGVDVLFLTPGCAICHQSLGIIQDACEKEGMATISITLKPEVTQFINIPRAAYIRFPYGYPVGPAFNPSLQKEILIKSLELIHLLKEPGMVVKLPYRWSGIKQENKIKSADPRTQALINHIDEMQVLLKAIVNDMASAQTLEMQKMEPDQHKINFYQSQSQRAMKLSKLLENEAVDQVHGLRNLSGPIKYLREG
jgi:D-proline reductase (dithiol) PrdB